MFYEALVIARKAHKGQVDKNGKPYLEHPIRVSEGTDVYTLKVIALLHDVIEDSDYTEDDLREKFPTKVVDAVVALTHMDNEPYFQYIEKVRQNSRAKIVKRLDLKDNLNKKRIMGLDKNTQARITSKYMQALKILSS